MREILTKKSKGFGIAEALIASTIIAVILFALVAVGRNSIRGVEEAEKRFQAISLAQEGIEQVRQMRDNNWVSESGGDWNDIVWDGDTLTKVTTGLEYIIGYNNTGMRYGLLEKPSDPDPISLNGNNFKRIIRIDSVGGLISANPADPSSDPMAASNAIKVTASINYDGLNKPIEISEVLTNWRPAY
jgi:type II secretory pathway pseudopilin PulG